MSDNQIAFPVMADFENDGRSVLVSLIDRSPWASLAQAIASLTIFAHPDVVMSLKARAVFRTIRGAPKGSIENEVMLDDNASPATAFKWATRLKLGRDLNCNHIYPASRDPDAYSDVRNICYTPNFIAKLTDSQRKIPSEDHLLHLLRYRAFELYGYAGPSGQSPPSKRASYGKLFWSDPIGKGANPRQMEEFFRKNMNRRKKDRLTKSVHLIGWTFSDYRPDTSVSYIG